MKRLLQGHQEWRWFHDSMTPVRDVEPRPRRYWMFLILLGVSLNVGLTMFAVV